MSAKRHIMKMKIKPGMFAESVEGEKYIYLENIDGFRFYQNILKPEQLSFIDIKKIALDKHFKEVVYERNINSYN